MTISIAIMAAGLGTRMKSTLPKVLHEISGFEMLYHIIKESQKISDDIHVILYHQAELVQERMNRYFPTSHTSFKTIKTSQARAVRFAV